MVLFLEGLSVRIARKVYEGVKLDMKKLETFKRSGAFKEAIKATLNHNCAGANFNRLGLHANRELQEKETISAIFQRLEWKPPTPVKVEVTRPRQALPTQALPPAQAPLMRPNASEDMMVGIVEEM